MSVFCLVCPPFSTKLIFNLYNAFYKNLRVSAFFFFPTCYVTNNRPQKGCWSQIYMQQQTSFASYSKQYTTTKLYTTTSQHQKRLPGDWLMLFWGLGMEECRNLYNSKNKLSCETRKISSVRQNEMLKSCYSTYQQWNVMMEHALLSVLHFTQHIQCMDFTLWVLTNVDCWGVWHEAFTLTSKPNRSAEARWLINTGGVTQLDCCAGNGTWKAASRQIDVHDLYRIQK